jgi:hypothetical protein
MVVAKKRRAQMVQRTCEVAGLMETVVEFTGEFQEYRRKAVVAQAGHGAQRPTGFSRRKFFLGLGVSVATLLLPKFAVAEVLQIGASANDVQAVPELLYPPIDLSYFNTPIGGRA